MTPSAAGQQVVRAPAGGRVYTQWTTTDLEVAEALTSGGSLQRAADLCWSLLGDSRVMASLGTRVKGLLKLPLAWERSGDGRSGARVIRALDGGDFWLAHSEAALSSLAAWGILLGVGLAQRVWELRGGRWVGVLRPYDARFLRWDTQRRVWMVRTTAGEVEIRRDDRRWVLYAPSCSGLPDGDERPWLYGAWRAAGRPWLLKWHGLGDFGQHSATHGSPIRTADYDGTLASGAPSRDVREDLCTTLGAIGADTAIVPPPGMKLRLMEATAATWQMFPAQSDLAAREIVIALTGQSSSTEIASGQETGATLHGQVRQDLIDADAQTLSTCIREQSLVDYAAYNFGSGELAPWPRWKTDPPANAKARGEAMKALGEGVLAADAAAPDGFQVDRAAVFEAAGIPLVESSRAASSGPRGLAEAAAELRDDGWPVALSGGAALLEVDGEQFAVPLAAGGVTNFPGEGDDLAVSLRNSRFDRVPLGYALALRDDHPDVWRKGGNILGNRQFSRLLPVVRRGGKPTTATEELAVRLREAWAARHAGAGTGATIAGAVAAVKWWTFLNRAADLRAVISAATKDDE